MNPWTDGIHADGYEASFALGSGTYTIRIHVEEEGMNTAAISDFIDVFFIYQIFPAVYRAILLAGNHPSARGISIFSP